MNEMLGGARITYLGHSTFRFVTAGGEQIIIDPWLADNPQTPEDLKQVDELHTILVTYGHFDHFDDVIPLAEQTGATLLKEVAGRLKERERDATVRIKQIQNDLKQAEALREELRRDIALCERRIGELGNHEPLDEKV